MSADDLDPALPSRPEPHTDSSADGALDTLARSLWAELAQGRCVAQRSTHTTTHFVLQVVRCSQSRTDGDYRNHAYLRRVLVGETPKELAYASHCSTSTIAGATAASLSQMGFNRRLLCVPFPLVYAAHLASGFQLPPAQVALAASGAGWCVGIERPELRLRGRLSASECDVLGSIMEGHTNAETALIRGVAIRTIANQIASLSAKLGTSGRLELLRAMVRGNGRDASRHPRVECAAVGPALRFPAHSGAADKGLRL